MAKCWPDEQEADAERRAWMGCPKSLKPGTGKERHGTADPTGWHAQESEEVMAGASASLRERANRTSTR